MNKEDIFFGILIPMALTVFIVCAAGAPFWAALMVGYIFENNYWSRETTLCLRNIDKHSKSVAIEIQGNT